ncbi:unnamed protein product [Lactuca virosa]|uniref:Uncharacterized protein n=1 Tax=Lactuca virosa TaxID=75947 RepID=A0AAU9LZ07_9ASTR|nr:unnamed protein product [Lactuca virosa]
MLFESKSLTSTVLLSVSLDLSNAPLQHHIFVFIWIMQSIMYPISLFTPLFFGINLGRSLQDIHKNASGEIIGEGNETRKLLGKCVEELKKKGFEFYLLKEVNTLRRAKSLGLKAKL